MTVPSKQRAREILEIANQAHPDLKFELETPDNEGFLPILDTKIRISDDGCLEHTYCTKKANKGLILPYPSHHPKRLPHNIAKNQSTRMEKLSDDRHRAADQRRMQQKLLDNENPEDTVTKLQLQKPKRNASNGMSQKHKATLCIPFFSEKQQHFSQKGNLFTRT